jgi:hypothetical protein
MYSFGKGRARENRNWRQYTAARRQQIVAATELRINIPDGVVAELIVDALCK